MTLVIIDASRIPHVRPSLDRNSYQPREDKSVPPKKIPRRGHEFAVVRDTFQGRFALTTASAIGIHVAAYTSRARTQVMRRASGTGREMPRLASPMTPDVAAALGRIVPAWGPPPPPLPLLYLSTKPAVLRMVLAVPHLRSFLRSLVTVLERAVPQSRISFASTATRRAARQYRAETAPLSSSSASLSTHRVSKGQTDGPVSPSS